MKDKQANSRRRRDFLKLASAGAGLAAVAASGLARPKAASAAEKPSGQPAAGYRETEQVKKYYALARF